MPTFLKALRSGGPSFRVEDTLEGFQITRVAGHEGQFNLIVREVINRADDDFTALPRHDGEGGYDRVQIIPHD